MNISGKRILVNLLVLAMLLTMMPSMVFAESAPAINGVAGDGVVIDNTSGDGVIQNQDDPPQDNEGGKEEQQDSQPEGKAEEPGTQVESEVSAKSGTIKAQANEVTRTVRNFSELQSAVEDYNINGYQELTILIAEDITIENRLYASNEDGNLLRIKSQNPSNPKTLIRDSSYKGDLFYIYQIGFELESIIISGGGSEVSGVTGSLIRSDGSSQIYIMNNTTLKDNITSDSGGAIYKKGGTGVIFIENGVFSGNSSSSPKGSAIFIADPNDHNSQTSVGVVINNGTFNNNSGNQKGKDIYIDDPHCNLQLGGILKINGGIHSLPRLSTIQIIKNIDPSSKIRLSGNSYYLDMWKGSTVAVKTNGESLTSAEAKCFVSTDDQFFGIPDGTSVKWGVLTQSRVSSYTQLRDEILTFNSGTDSMVITLASDFPTDSNTVITGSLNINNSNARELTITSENTSSPKIILRNYNADMFSVIKGELTLNDIIIDGGGPDRISHGSLVRVESGAKLNVQNGSILRNNRIQNLNGAGVYNLGNMAISGGEIINNISGGNGGGVYNIGVMNVIGGEIKSNNAGVYGGGICNLNNGALNIYGGKINHNTADVGGGIHNTAVTNINNGEIKNNNAANGGGLHNTKTTVINGGEINDNNATTADGGGIYNTNNGTITITGGIINGNVSKNNGHGIFTTGMLGAKLYLKNNPIIKDSIYSSRKLSETIEIQDNLTTDEEIKIEGSAVEGQMQPSALVATKTGGTLLSPDEAKLFVSSDGELVGEKSSNSVVWRASYISVNPKVLDFGRSEYGQLQPEAQTITVKNESALLTGNIPITLSSANLGQFNISDADITINNPGDTGTFTVQPNKNLLPGTYNATVTVGNEDTGKKTVNIIYIVDDVYDISLTPANNLNFGTIIYGTDPEGKSVTVKNEGTTSTGEMSINLGGTNASSFILSQNKMTITTAGSIGNFTITPNEDLRPGTYNATVSVGNKKTTAKTINITYTVEQSNEIGSYKQLKTMLALFNSGDEDMAFVLKDIFPADIHPKETFTINNPNQTLTITSENTDNPGVITRPDGFTGHMFAVNNGTLNMQAVTVDGGGADVESVEGSLIYVDNEAKLNINNRTKLQNNISSDKNGGGVYNAGTFIMNGGCIQKNTAKNAGGVFNTGNNAIFIMNDGVISDNMVSGYGGGVSINNAIFSMYGGNIKGNISTSGGGGGVYDVGSFTLENGNISDNTGRYQGGGVLINGANSTFVMNGGSISANKSSGGAGLCNNGGTFTLENGKISNNTSGSYGGGIYSSGGTSTVKGGNVTGNTANAGGGVFNKDTQSKFVLDGGNISNNTAYDGGGIYYNYGTFAMNGGSILNNTADGGNGGGLYANNVKFIMTNGNILNNTASKNGGSIYNGPNSVVTMTGGNLSGNTGLYGESVYIVKGVNSRIELKDNPIISDSIYSAKSLPESIVITGDLNTTTPIKIKGSDIENQMEPGVIVAKKTGGDSLTEEEANLFVSANNKLIGIKEDNNVVWDLSTISTPEDLEAAIEDFNNSDKDKELMVEDGVIDGVVSNGGIIIDNDSNATLTIKPEGESSITVERPAENDNEIFIVENGNLVLENIVIDGGASEGREVNGPLVTVKAPAKFTLNSGAKLTNNNNISEDIYGGAVHNAGTFNLKGGTVDKCESIKGGGIFNTGTANLKSGLIEANKASDDNAGSGVHAQSGKINLSGDIKVLDGIFTKAKPRNVISITGQLTDTASILIEGSAVARQMDKGAVVASKVANVGSLTKKEAAAFKDETGNLKGAASGNKVVWDDTRLVEDFNDIGEVIGDFNEGDEDKVIVIPGDFDDSNMPEEPIVIDNADNELTIISEDKDNPSVIERPNGNEDELFIVSEGALTTEDIIIDGGSEEGLKAQGPIITVNAGAKYISKDGTVLRNNNNISESKFGGAVGSRGTVNLFGGKIDNCVSKYGGGIFTEGTLNVTKTNIKGNMAVANGTGVYIESGTMKVTNVPSITDGIYSKAKLSDALLIGGDLNSKAKLVVLGSDTLEAGTVVATKDSSANALTNDEAKSFVSSDSSLVGKKDGNKVVLGAHKEATNPEELGDVIDEFNEGDEDVVITIPEDFDDKDMPDEPIIIDNPEHEVIIGGENPDNPTVIDRPAGNDEEIIIVSDGALTLEDVVIDGGSSEGREVNGPLVTVKAPAKFTLNSGAKLTNNNNISTDIYGGAVHNAGTFVLNGGAVDKCESVKGGGIFNTGTANLKSGTIEANKAADSNAGRGVHAQSGKINLSGDIKVLDGIFTKAKPRNVISITGQLADTSSILIEGSAVAGQMDKGAVVASKSTNAGSLTKKEAAVFKDETGNLKGTASGNKVLWDDTRLVEDFNDIGEVIGDFNEGDEDKVIVIPGDFDDTNMPEEPIVIDNSDHELTIISEDKDSPSVIERPNSNEEELFIVSEGALTTENIIIDGGSEEGLNAQGPIITVNAGAKYISKDGTVLRNNNNISETKLGGAVGSKGIVNLFGGKIDNCVSKYGGGIFTEGTLNVTKTNIKGNTAVTNGAGVYIESGTMKVTNVPSITDGIYSKAKLSDALLIGGDLNSKAKLVVLGSDTLEAGAVVATKISEAGTLSADEAKTFTTSDDNFIGKKDGNKVVLGTQKTATNPEELGDVIDEFNNGDEDVVITLSEDFDDKDMPDEPIVIDNHEHEVIIGGEDPDNPTVIDRPAGNDEEIIIVSDGALTLEDVVIDGGASEGREVNGPLVTVKTPAEFTLNSGAKLTNNNNISEDIYGGAVHNAGTFNLKGGTVDKCQSVKGGGIFNTGIANLKAGIIEANKASDNNAGSGVHAEAGKINLSGDIKIKDGLFVKDLLKDVLNVSDSLTKTAYILLEGSDAENQFVKGTEVAKYDGKDQLTSQDARAFRYINSGIERIGAVKAGNEYIAWQYSAPTLNVPEIQFDQSVKGENNKDLTFVLETGIYAPEEMYIDGNKLEENEDYTVTETGDGQYTFTISKDFLDTLEQGDYEFNVKMGESLLGDGTTVEDVVIKLSVVDTLPVIKEVKANKDSLPTKGGAVNLTLKGDNLDGKKIIVKALVGNKETQVGGEYTYSDPLTVVFPENTHYLDKEYTLSVKVEGEDWFHETFNVTVGHELTSPVISKVQPSGIDAELKGNIVITFNEAMDKASVGSVNLSGEMLTETGTWSEDGKVYSIPYSGLEYIKDYTLAIAGFKDLAGNEMAADDSYGFKTKHRVGIELSQKEDYEFDSVYSYYEDAPEPLSVKVTNVGTKTMGKLDIKLTGEGRESFELSKVKTENLLPEASTYFTVTPLIELPVGTHTATVSVTNNDNINEYFNVTFKVLKSARKDITEFALDGQLGTSHIDYDKKTVTVVMPTTADVTSLVPTITHQGISIDPNSGVATDFSSAKTYTVTAEDGSEKEYTVSVVSPEITGITVTQTNHGPEGGDSTVSVEGDNLVGQIIKVQAFESKSDNATDIISERLYPDTHTLEFPQNTSPADKEYTIKAMVLGGEWIISSQNVTVEKENTPPILTKVSPSGNGVAVSGNLVLTFNEAMNQNITGTIMLNGTELEANGTWNENGTKYTVTYDGLEYVTEYKVSVDGFKDMAGNSMGKNDKSTFVTEHNYDIKISQTKDHTFATELAGYEQLPEPLKVDVTNTGTGSTGPMTVVIEGDNPDAFQVDKDTLDSLTNGSKDSFEVSPKLSLIKGIYNATVKVKGKAGMEKSFNVNFEVETSGTNSITGFNIENQIGLTAIDQDQNTIKVVMPYGTDMSDLTPTIIHEGESLSPETGISQNFERKVIYTVEAANGDEREYEVIVETPDIEKIEVKTIDFDDKGGESLIEINGNHLVSQEILVKAFLGNSETEIQTTRLYPDEFRLEFPENTDARDKVYTVKASLDGGKTWIRSNNNVTVSHELTVPEIMEVSPKGTISEMNGQIVIDFTEEMDADVKGVVTLNDTVLDEGIWSENGTRYSIDYTDLSFGDRYKITVKGFKDLAGNAMMDDGTNTFITGHNYGIELDPKEAYEFPVVDMGYESVEPLNVTITNTGSGVTGKLNISLSGDNADSFVLSKKAGDSLLAGGTDEFTVEPKVGLDGGIYNATVIVKGNNKINESIDINFIVKQAGGDRITDFTIDGQIGNTVIDHEKGKINILMPYGSDLEDVVPDIAHAGVNIEPGIDEAQDFNGPVVYTVTSSDGLTKEYAVFVETPEISGITAEIACMDEMGGDNLITIDGKHLVQQNIIVKALDGKTETGIRAERMYPDQLILTFPQNHTAKDKVYTLKASLDNGESWITGTTTVTVGHETVQPTITSLNPTGSGIKPSGNVVISFSEAMNPDAEGKIIINNEEMTAQGTWNDDHTVYTMPYDDLNNGTEYKLTVKGFEDIAGNVMDEDNNYSFKTEDSYEVELSQTESYEFDSLPIGYESVTGFAVTVANKGTAATGELKVELEGDDADKFALSTEIISDISSGSDTVFTVTPNMDLDKGTYKAVVKVSGQNNIEESFEVSFTVLKSDKKQITEFELAGQAGDTVIDEEAGTIDIEMSYDVDVTYIAPSVTHSGISLAPASDEKQDFTNEVVYTVTAEDGTTKDYTVKVTIPEIHRLTLSHQGTYEFDSRIKDYEDTPDALLVTAKNTGNMKLAGLELEVTGDAIDAFTVSSEELSELDVKDEYGFAVQPKDGLDIGTYEATVTIKGNDGISESLDVKFQVNRLGAKEITDFTIAEQIGATVINEDTNTIEILMPSNTDVSKLIPEIIHTGDSINPESGEEVDFTNPVTYTVTAGNGSAKDYIVTVNLEAEGTKPVVEKVLPTGEGADLDGHVAVKFNKRMDVAQNGTIRLTGGSSQSEIELTQGGIWSDDGRIFKIAYSELEPMTDYNIDIDGFVDGTGNVMDSADGYTFKTQHGYGIKLSQSGRYEFPSEVTGYTDLPDELEVTVENSGTDNTGKLDVKLSGTGKDSFKISKDKIDDLNVDGTDKFTVQPNEDLPVGLHEATVIVTGNNKIREMFEVAFRVYSDDASDILSFSIPRQIGGTIIDESTQTITIVMPEGTNLEQLKPVVEHSGVSIEPAAGSVVDFTDTVEYKVKAKNGNEKVYSVNVIEYEPFVEKYRVGLSQIETYEFETKIDGYTEYSEELVVDVVNKGNMPTGQLNIALSGNDASSFVISKPEIDSLEIDDTDSFTVQAKPGLAMRTYNAKVTVTGENGISEEFAIKFKVGSPDAMKITSFNIENQVGNTEIDQDAKEINILMAHGTDVTNLVPEIKFEGSQINPSVGDAVDFAEPVSYKVISGSGNETTYTVTVTVEEAVSLPEVTNVLPANEDNPRSGNLRITFNKTMDTSASGKVKLIDMSDGSIVKVTNDGAWTKDGRTYVVPYEGLEYGKEYTVALQKFADKDGGVMDVNEDNTFTTVHEHGISLDVEDEYQFESIESGFERYDNPLSVTVTNEGTAEEGPLTVELSGDDADKFQLSNDITGETGRLTVDRIAVGQTGSFNVEPITGLTTGNYRTEVKITGANGINQSFVVRLTVEPASTNQITSFEIEDQVGDTVIDHDKGTIEVLMVYGSEMDKLTPTIKHSGVSINPASKVTVDLDGKSEKYTVTAENGDTREYTVTAKMDRDNRPPEVTSITPNGEDAPLNGQIRVNFSKSMNMEIGETPGKSPSIKLNGQEMINDINEDVMFTNGGRTLIIGYSNLSYETDYKVEVSGFEDKYGIDMVDAAPVTFKTVKEYELSLSQTGEHTFENKLEGYAVAPDGLRVKVSSKVATGKLKVQLGGYDPEAFKLSVDEIPALSEGQEGTFKVTPDTGLGKGTYEATVIVRDGEVSKSFNIKFTVEPPVMVSLIIYGNGGSPTMTKQTTKYSGHLGDLPMVTRQGYVFAGWYLSKTSKDQPVTSETIVDFTKMTPIYAHWVPAGSAMNNIINSSGTNHIDNIADSIISDTIDNPVSKLAIEPKPTLSSMQFKAPVALKKATSKATVKFNANKGKIGKKKFKSLSKAKNKKIGKLPTPKRKGYQFKGWYTKKKGGKKIKANARVVKNVTYFAQWKKK